LKFLFAIFTRQFSFQDVYLFDVDFKNKGRFTVAELFFFEFWGVAAAAAAAAAVAAVAAADAANWLYLFRFGYFLVDVFLFHQILLFF
jgi:hypothetical protein